MAEVFAMVVNKACSEMERFASKETSGRLEAGHSFCRQKVTRRSSFRNGQQDAYLLSRAEVSICLQSTH